MDFITSFFKSFGLAILDIVLISALAFSGLLFALNQTLLNRDFTVAQVEKLDTVTLGEYIIRDQVISQVAIPIYLPIEDFIEGAVNETLTELEPWLKQQSKDIVNDIYDYLEGKSQSLNIVIELESVKRQVQNNISQAVIASPPPGLTDVPPATIERYLEPFYDRIPSSFEIDENWLGPYTMAQIDTLKQLVSNFHIFFFALIGFILFLMLCVILINHEVRGSTRSLGVAFLGGAVVSYGVVWLTRDAIAAQSALPQVPVYLQSWLPELMTDILSPMVPYSYGLAGMGVVLLIVSFAYRRQAE